MISMSMQSSNTRNARFVSSVFVVVVVVVVVGIGSISQACYSFSVQPEYSVRARHDQVRRSSHAPITTLLSASTEPTCLDTCNATSANSVTAKGSVQDDCAGDDEIRNLFNTDSYLFSKSQSSSSLPTHTTAASAVANPSSSYSRLEPLSDEEREDLKNQIRIEIDRIVSNGVMDLTKLRNRWREKCIDQKRLEDAMKLNFLIQEKAFDDKIEDIINTFLSDTQNERDKTHRLFEEDELKRQLKEKEAKEKSKPRPIEPWGLTNNEYDEYDRWDGWGW